MLFDLTKREGSSTFRLFFNWIHILNLNKLKAQHKDADPVRKIFVTEAQIQRFQRLPHSEDLVLRRYRLGPRETSGVSDGTS